MYHYLAKSSTIFCDATGTVVSLKKFKSNDTLLYYAMVLNNQTHTSLPVAVAEFISTEHSVIAVSHFLECFRRAEGLLFGYGNVVLPKHVVIDRSLVLLLSFLRVYNFETLSEYLYTDVL